MHQRRQKKHRRTLKNITSAATTSYRHLDRAASTIGRWIVTDHTGFTQSMLDMPPMGFKASCRYIMHNFLVAVAGALLTGIIAFVMIAYGVPVLFSLLFS